MPSDEEREARDALIGDRPGAPSVEERADTDLLFQLLGDESTWAEPSGALEDVIVRAVGDAQAAGHGATVAAIDTAAAAGGARVEGGARRRQRAWRGRRRAFAGTGIAATAAAIAAVVGLAVSGPSAQHVQFDGRLASGPFGHDAAGSVGVTRNDSGFRVVLHATHLPLLPTGRYYEAWLQNEHGTLVPIGTFSSGEYPITMWAGVPPTQYSTMVVTIEAADGNQQSSGQTVLVGPLTPADR